MYLLTSLGHRYLCEFLVENFNDFENQNPDDWVSHAEALATDNDNEPVTIQVGADESNSQCPEVLVIPRSYFKYHQLGGSNHDL